MLDYYLFYNDRSIKADTFAVVSQDSFDCNTIRFSFVFHRFEQIGAMK